MDPIKIGLIGGSGMGEALGAQTSGVRHELETPFGRPSGPIVETEWAGLPVFVLSRHGEGHVHNPSLVPYRANLFAMKQLGVTHVIASGAVGSLREEFKPRDLVIPDQIIDKTHKRPNTFYEQAAVHVEFAEPFCPVLRRVLVEAGKRKDESEIPNLKSEISNLQSEIPDPRSMALRVHDRGCYVCMEGPAFSTRAESLMHRLWGGDLVGMTAMPEAKLAKEAEISYALVALVTDYDCWRQRPADAAAQKDQPDPFVLLSEIIGNLREASNNAIELMKRAVSLIAGRREQLLDYPAKHALKLGIWTDKDRIPAEEVERLRPLWGKYF